MLPRRLFLPLFVLLTVAVAAVGSGEAATRSTLPMLVTVSPDGTRIAWADGFRWQVWVADADGSKVHAVGTPFVDGIGQLTWTRFGLVADSNYTLTLLTQSGRRLEIGGVGDQQFSVGGAHAASGNVGCEFCHGPVSIYNIRTHTVVRLGNPKKPNEDAALSPEGARVAYDSPRGLVVQRAGGGPVHVLSTAPACNISWSPDGQTLALGSTGIALQPAAGGGPVTLIAPSRGAACVGDYVPAWSPDSSEIVFARVSGGSGSSNTIGQLAVIDVHTRALRQTPKRLGTVTSYAWSPDGKSIFATFRDNDACGTIRRLDATNLTGTALYRAAPDSSQGESGEPTCGGAFGLSLTAGPCSR